MGLSASNPLCGTTHPSHFTLSRYFGHSISLFDMGQNFSLSWALTGCPPVFHSWFCVRSCIINTRHLCFSAQWPFHAQTSHVGKAAEQIMSKTVLVLWMLSGMLSTVLDQRGEPDTPVLEFHLCKRGNDIGHCQVI